MEKQLLIAPSAKKSLERKYDFKSKKFCPHPRIYARYASKAANAVTPNPIGLSIEAQFRTTNVKLQV